MRTFVRWIVRLMAVLGAAAAIGGFAFATRGLSSRSLPSPVERSLARWARHLLIPAEARRRTNPLPATPELHASALRHWADHCSICHGNDGKGATTIGRSLYPRAPDMTLPATQNLSDGELFWIIENGVKLTGMPAWGTPSPDDDAETWELVHLVRWLPQITAAELAAMTRLNPVSRESVEQELEIERFLAGEESTGEPTEGSPGHSSSGGNEGHH